MSGAGGKANVTFEAENVADWHLAAVDTQW